MRIDDNKLRNVVVYARVSTEHEAQLYALENQIDWYDSLLQNHPNWNIITKYIDRGITGTSATKRPQFMRMIDDAKTGTFDLIVTREVSRFARNTVDTLQYTRDLKKSNIEVYFVEDNIWTFDPDGELRLTIMATLAQDESRKLSIRVKAGQRTSMEKGVFFQNGSILGYDKVGDQMIKNPEQAETVRMIFDNYLSGMGVRKIQFELESKGRKTARGSDHWTASVICRVLRNKFYAGYNVWYKQYVPDFLEQKKVNNHGEKEQFEVLGTHEPIVTLEEWERVQKRLDESCNIINNRRVPVKTSDNIWVKKLRCSCGKTFNRKPWHTDKKSGTIQYGYQCYSSIKTGSVITRSKKGLSIDGICTSPAISQWKLEAMALYIFKGVILNKDEIFSKALAEIEKHKDLLKEEFHNEELQQLQNELDRYNKKMDNLIEMRTDGDITKEKFSEKKEQFEEQIRSLENQIESLSNSDHKILSVSEKLEMIKQSLSDLLCISIDDKIPDYIIDALVESITVDNYKFTWRLKYPSQEQLLQITGSKKNHVVKKIENNIEKSPLFDKCNTGSINGNSEQAVITFSNTSVDRLFTKEMAKIYGGLKATNRLHKWFDIIIEIKF